MLLFISILVGWLDMINSCIAILSVVLFYLSFFLCCTYIFLLFFHYDFLILVD